MSTTGSITGLSIPGIAGLGNISAQAAYNILAKNGDAKELALVAKAPAVKREQDYFDKQIAQIKTVDDFVKDTRLVNYVLSAYGLSSESDKMGIIKKVLTENPADKNSLVNKLADTRFATMAKDLDFYDVGLANLKGGNTKDSFSVQALGNRYFETQIQTVGQPSKTFFTNTANVTVDASGKLKTADGMVLMGMKLDNKGNIQKPLDATAGYQTTDLQAVQVNWLDNKYTPTKTVVPNVTLNSQQPVASTNEYTTAQVIKNSAGQDQVVQIKLSRPDSGTDQWTFAATLSDGTQLASQTYTLAFDDAGNISSVNGTAGSNISLDVHWSDDPDDKTTQSFDLAPIVKHADFTQTMSVYDQTGMSRNLRLEYNKSSDDENRWQVKVYYADYGTLETTLDVSFNDDGSVKGVGTYNPDTGAVEAPDGNRSAKSANVSIDWQRGSGPSNIALDLSNVFSRPGLNSQLKKTTNDSIHVGARTAVNIDDSGLVTATYNKADGSGSVSVKLYQLPMASFDKSYNLFKSPSHAGYYQATDDSGAMTLRPAGTGDGKAGKLAAPAKTTSTTSFIDTLKTKYDQNQYEVALGDQNEALRYAVYFKAHAGSITNMYSLMADTALRDVVSTVFQLPANMVNQPIETQYAAFNRRLDVKKLQDPKFIDQFVKRFLAISDAASANSANSYQVSLLDGSASSSNLISLVGSNINTSA